MSRTITVEKTVLMGRVTGEGRNQGNERFIMFSRAASSAVIFASSAMATAGMFGLIGDAHATCDCTISNLLPTSSARPLSRANWEYAWAYEDGYVYEGAVDTDALYNFSQAAAPSVYFYYYPSSINSTTYVRACRQSFSSSTSTCAATSSFYQTTWGVKNINPSVSGLYGTGVSTWSHFPVRTWGAVNLSGIVGATVVLPKCWA